MSSAGLVPLTNIVRENEILFHLYNTHISCVRAVGGGDAAVAVRIVNDIDPQTISDALATSAGEKVILNTIRRNAAGIKQLLR